MTWPHKNRLARGISAMAAAGLIGIVRLYQAALSPWLGRQCRFVPTCSHYFIDAVRKRGPWKGLLMGLWRVLRCNPFSKGGLDPVEPPPDRQPPPPRPEDRT